MNAADIPGPWETTAKDDEDTRSRIFWAVCKQNAGDIVAEIRVGPNAEQYANLIAAAPDLLAALMASINLLDTNDNEAREAYKLARRAIAKATEQEAGQ